MFRPLSPVLLKVGVRLARKRFEYRTRLWRTDVGQCVGAFPLKLVEVVPIDDMLKRNLHGLCYGADSAAITDQAELENDVFVKLVRIVEQ